MSSRPKLDSFIVERSGETRSLPMLTTTLAATTAALVGTLSYAAFSPGSQLFGNTLIAGTDPNQAALTYDDGPNDTTTAALLDLLAARNVRATFFLLGKYVRQQPALTRRIHAAGHLIGNHTETHPWLHRCSTARVRQELTTCNRILEDTLGASIHYMRPPHGARRPAVFRIARELGLTVTQWNAIGYDWRAISASQILSNLEPGIARARRRGIGVNMLLHDGSDRALGADRSATLAATAALIQRFALTGTQMVTVDAWG